MITYDNRTTVQFQITANTFGIKTFDSGVEAFDFIHAATNAGLIIRLMSVSVHGAAEYSRRGAQVYATNQATLDALAAVVADSITD